MKKFLLFIGWSALIGGVLDSLISVYAIFIIAFNNDVNVSLSVNILFKDYISFLYPIKQFAYYIMYDNFVFWLFALPALVLFPFRVIVSAIIGKWAFMEAKSIRKKYLRGSLKTTDYETAIGRGEKLILETHNAKRNCATVEQSQRGEG
jgi:hypothetical protein